MRIGEVAVTAEVSAQTIRFYEHRGLLPQPLRGPNGYREYEASILSRLAFIRSGQTAGLTLLEVASILDLRREGVAPCAHVNDLLGTKLLAVQEQQRRLTRLEAELQQLLERSRGLDPADCVDEQICHIITPKD